jgi:hypothetical protein
MARREELFNLSLDALLVGGAPQAMPDNDAQGTLDFARKMIALRPSPRPEFQSRLKARLLTKLAEQEAKRRQPN